MPAHKFTSVNLREARLEDVAPLINMAMFGKKGAGKSTCMQYTCLSLHRQKRYANFILVSSNHDAAMQWGKVIPKLYIHTKPDPNYVVAVKDYMNGEIQKDREVYVRKHGSDDGYHVPYHLRTLWIFEDVGPLKKFMFHPIFADIMSNCRHYGFGTAWLCQYWHQMPLQNRTQLDVIAVMKTPSSKNCRKVYDEFVDDTMCTYRTFRYIMNSATKERGCCLWLDNMTQDATRIEDKVFFKRIPFPLVLHLVGSQKYREVAEERDRRVVTEKARLAAQHHQRPHSPVAPSEMHVKEDKFHDMAGTCVIRRTPFLG